MVIILLSQITAAANYNILQEAVLQSPGTSQSDWCAIALAASDMPFDKTSYISQLKNYLAEKYQSESKLSYNKSTEWHRIAIAVNLLGYDATNFNGINLINDGIYYRENLSRQGLNGYIWALITLSSGNFTEPDDALNTKESILSAILSKQNTDGSFSLSGNTPSCDITAMALYAISFYKTRAEVSIAIDNALNYLSSVQNIDGSFSEEGTANAESTAQVIIALSALGIDVNNDARFPNIYNALLSFETNGGFCHIQGGEADVIATCQGLCAAEAAKSRGWVYSDYQADSKPEQIEAVNTAEVKPQTEEETEKTISFELGEHAQTEAAAVLPTDNTQKTAENEEDNKTMYFLIVIPFVLLLFYIITRRRKCGKN